MCHGTLKASPGRTKHTLAMADGFGFNGKKQLEQTKWNISVAPKTVGKGLRDDADTLDDQDTHQCPWLAQHCTWDRTETGNAIRNERSREIHVWSHARSEMHAQTLVQVIQ